MKALTTPALANCSVMRACALRPPATVAAVPQRLQVRAASSAPGSSGDTSPVHILGISGSLRKGSCNNGMLRAAAKRLPPNVTLEIADLSQLPLYNDDLWQGLDAKNDDSALPASVRKLREQVKKCDAILFACPEYNFGISSVLKTAIDWGSKGPNVWAGKVAGVMGAGGGAGTARAQLNLKSMYFIDLQWAPFRHDVQINRFASGHFNAETGDVVDKVLEDRIAGLVDGIAVYARKMRTLPK